MPRKKPLSKELACRNTSFDKFQIELKKIRDLLEDKLLLETQKENYLKNPSLSLLTEDEFQYLISKTEYTPKISVSQIEILRRAIAELDKIYTLHMEAACLSPRTDIRFINFLLFPSGIFSSHLYSQIYKKENPDVKALDPLDALRKAEEAIDNFQTHPNFKSIFDSIKVARDNLKLNATILQSNSSNHPYYLLIRNFEETLNKSSKIGRKPFSELNFLACALVCHFQDKIKKPCNEIVGKYIEYKMPSFIKKRLQEIRPEKEQDYLAKKYHSITNDLTKNYKEKFQTQYYPSLLNLYKINKL